ncbi:non-specific lipid-transfer protein 2-like [Cornus florida]|uniref:non-specific lipid-transfer protein 2-like n=1 Tax=Cornus florida TaxID=4283 RepID=UPI00289BE5E7|nr:non-specific lipid-transfer protein 2-like [Cornus florida]
MKKACLAVAVCVVMVVLLGEVGVTSAVTCKAVELSSCYAAITSSQPPSSQCCSKLREQRPCLCGYLKDPNLSQYVNSPGAKRVASACGVSTPKC